MPHRIEAAVCTAQFTASLLGVGGLWFANTVTNGANWLEEYGITGAIIAALITVIKLQWNNDQKARVEALAAKDALIVAAKESAAIHQATATELIKATYHQTEELVKFNERLIAIDGMVRQCPNAKQTKP